VETEEGEMAMLKSEIGGGGGAEEVPHPSNKDELQTTIMSKREFFVTASSNITFREFAAARSSARLFTDDC
jgi:hypothetical protein